MANPFKKPISKVSVRQLLELDPEKISKLDVKESISFEKRLHKVTESRLRTIAKSGRVSPAQERYMPDGVPVQTVISNYSDSRKARSASQHNITVLMEFLNAKSSTLRGMYKLKKETEIRLFGANIRGEPLHRFTNIEQERRFWTAYNEFIYQKPLYGLESTRVQQFLAKMTFWRRRDYTADDFEVLLKNLEEKGHPGWSSVRWGENIEEEWK